MVEWMSMMSALAALFYRLDVHGTGYITRHDIREYFELHANRSLTHHMIDDMMDELDKDGG
jgi:Ca2+-binding EF-hand superfamily protein